MMNKHTIEEPQPYDQTLSFTDRSWEMFYGIIETDYFQENEAGAIFESLSKKMESIPFGDYLRRYIYKQAGMSGSFRSIDDEVYRQIILDSFRENIVPASFEPTTAKLSMLAKNWLTQQTVRRSVVLLLGFGLKMTEEEVDEMLLKALHEQALNEMDPMEVICAYCYRNGCGFSTYERLSQAYRSMPESISAAANDEEVRLLRQLQTLTEEDGEAVIKSRLRHVYQALYEEAQALIADMYNTTGYFSGCCAADITETDLEHVLSSAIPTDHHGNLIPASRSKLGSSFAEHRISRQRLHNLLSGKTQISRYDLITLSFFLWSQKKEVADDPKRRYVGFINATNKLLKECAFEEVYPVNPYECFLLMCLLSEVPLSTYADVWEMSYKDQPEDESI